MTELQHMLVGLSVTLLLWHLFLKRYFVTQKDMERWHKIISNFLFK